MKAREEQFLKFLMESPQFVIPIYQRTYSWEEKECEQLWNDIVRGGSDDLVSAHFVGSIVYIEEGLSQISHRAPKLVIDGQQRLTTVMLILAAIAKALGKNEPVEGFSAQKIREYYLLNSLEAGQRHYKLLLSQTDKDTLISIVTGKDHPIEPSERIIKNYDFFKNNIAECDSEHLNTVCKGLAKLVTVDIALSRGQDNPQLIFESMNSTGRELSQADLIRNYVLMGLEPDLQERLYEEYWRQMEIAFGQEAYKTHFDSFMRHYLTMKTGDIPRISDVYEAFKIYVRETNVRQTDGDCDEPLVRELRDYARYYCAMRLNDSEPDKLLRRAFHDLRQLKVEVAYPFLLELYRDYKNEILSKDEFEKAVRLTESYVFRRGVCEIPANSLNKTFATFTRELNKECYMKSIQARFLNFRSYRRFPGDDEFQRKIQIRDLYNSRSRSYWLRRLENYDSKERISVDEYTIEHIMPQNENISQKWRDELGPEWMRIRDTWLHTLGNLTLTGYNSEYGDKSFIEKRDMKNGFRNSRLRLNEGLGQVEKWNEDAIKQRAQRLAKIAVNVWPAPNLSEKELISYMQEPKSDSQYSFDDHPNLLIPTVWELFETFRKEVLALNPCITELIRKNYIRYEAEATFVTVYPQKKQLHLSLNMSFADIVDPREICRNVSGMNRHWRNAGVEVKLEKSDALPYVIGLVRQALELQFGDENDA